MSMLDAFEKSGKQQKIQEMRRVKMDIATSINTLMTQENSGLIMKIHEIVAHGFAILEGDEDSVAPAEWTKYNSMETQRKLQAELAKLANS